MIHSGKVPAALYAIHNILYIARYYIGEGMDSKALYKLMDWAEILPSLLVRGDGDTTEEFRSYLEGMGKEYPLLSGLLARFDQGETWPGATVEHDSGSVASSTTPANGALAGTPADLGLAEEWETFERHRQTLHEKAAGQFVLIQGDQILAVFPEQDRALAAAINQCRGPFLVKKID